jgi:hypothetical protein
VNLFAVRDFGDTLTRVPGGKMKPHVLIAFALAVGLLFSDSSVLLGQSTKEEESKTEVPTPTHSTAPPGPEKVIPLKVQVLLTEFDGTKKVKSLPYVSYMTARSDRANAYEFTKIRLGTKVPVYTGKDSGMQYIDVGTNIDCRARLVEGGAYRLTLVVERSWVDGSTDLSGTAGQLPEPIIRQFKNEMEVTLRDGQASEPTVATDSMTGKVMKIEVSLSVLKSL